MSGLTLFIEPINDEFAVLYRDAADSYNSTPLAERNSGFDLYCDKSSITFCYGSSIDTELMNYCVLVGQGCRVAAFDESGRRRAFWLAPRSSISGTPFTLANSIGLIDAGYRGVIKAAIRKPSGAHIEHSVRLTQLAAPDLLPWAEVRVVDRLPDSETARGEGGFGSTGTGISDSRDGTGVGSAGEESTDTDISDNYDGNELGSAGEGSTDMGAPVAYFS